VFDCIAHTDAPTFPEPDTATNRQPKRDAQPDSPANGRPELESKFEPDCHFRRPADQGHQ
jgi:hypothetical protein